MLLIFLISFFAHNKSKEYQSLLRTKNYKLLQKYPIGNYMKLIINLKTK